MINGLLSITMAATTAVSGAWFPYDPRPITVSQEYYATIQEHTKNETVYFFDRDLADMIQPYTGNYVNAYYEQYNYTPLKFSCEVRSGVPEILSVKPLNNDLQSTVFCLTKLEDRIKEFIEPYDRNKVDNIALGYLRSMNKNYSNEGSYMKEHAWKLFAGDQEPASGAFSFIDTYQRYHQGVRYFFARYLDKASYNATDHGSARNSTDGWAEGGHLLPDPMNEGAIDLIHFFATIDGSWGGTSYNNNEDIFNLNNTNFQKDIVGWGGDLQTELSRLWNSDDEKSKFLDVKDFEEIINGKASLISREDILADIDGLNIAKLMDYGFTLTNAIRFYYDEIQNHRANRYKAFVKGMTEETTFDWGDCTLREKVFREAHALLDRKWNDQGYKDVNWATHLAEYALLYKDGIISSEYRDHMADLFAEWLCDKAGIE